MKLEVWIEIYILSLLEAISTALKIQNRIDKKKKKTPIIRLKTLKCVNDKPRTEALLRIVFLLK